MAKKQSDEKKTTSLAVLEKAAAALSASKGYPQATMLDVDGEPCCVVMAGASVQILIWAPEHDGAIAPAEKDMVMRLGASVPGGPASYCWATSTGVLGEGFVYSFIEGHEGEVPEIPPAATAKDQKRVEAIGRSSDPRVFKALQKEFDDLHEFIYQAKENIDSSNDITANLCKCIFLKMEHHPDFTVVDPGNAKGSAVEVLPYIDAAAIRKDPKQAVDIIKAGFSAVKNLPEYTSKDDFGRDFTIFDAQDYIQFSKPETYARIFECLGKHQLSRPEESGVEDDVLGRAFDVMLRGRFEGKGGMGVYLTPQQVRDAMVEMAFHDILADDPSVITRTDPKTGKKTFRVGDLTCGSAGFIVRAMREVRKHVERLVGMTNQQKSKLLQEIYQDGFIGADSAKNMVLMARINMALHGDPHARVYKVDNSLTEQVLKPESFDLILTNPPFKKGGVTEEDSAEVLKTYRSDIVDGKPQMAGDKLALGAKPDSKGVWKPVNSIDPAVLFIDRCLQLLKPGGRLLIVLPDGILCNSGDRYVREYLMGVKDKESGRFVGGKAIVKAVVSLPPITFRLSGAGAKTSFMYLQKKKPGDAQGSVFMAVADEVGFDVKQNKEILTDRNDLARILDIYRRGAPTTPQA